MNLLRKILILALLSGSLATGQAQNPNIGASPLADLEAEKAVTVEGLKTDTEFLSGYLCKGRGASQTGATEAALWVQRQFNNLDLMQMGAGYAQTFTAGGHVCRNIIGMLPARYVSRFSHPRYIIITAHYDNLGVIGGKTYPGADSNASGVVAMTALARMFKNLSDMGGGLQQTIIFAALDGKQLSMAGAQDLWSRVALGRLIDPMTGSPVKASDISAMVNIDIIGGTSSPISSYRDDYLILLGGGKYNGLLQSINIHNNINLELGLDYYGSKGFTDMFLNRVSDQKVFREKGVYAVMFTSGITMDTNRDTDTADKLNYRIMEKRIRLIFHWVERLMYLKR